MRVLVVSAVGGFVQGSICSGIALALRQLGHEAQVLSCAALAGMGERSRRLLRRQAWDQVIGYNYSALIPTPGGDLFLDLDVPVACWFFDDPLEHYDARAAHPGFLDFLRRRPDVSFFCWDRSLGERFAERLGRSATYLPAGYLGHAYDPLLRQLGEADEEDPVCDLGVLGNLVNPERLRLLAWLAEEPRRLHVHAAVFPQQGLTPALRRCLRPPLLTDLHRVVFFRSTAIYLETPANSGQSAINVKCLNALACGAFTLAPEAGDVQAAFGPDELPTYADDEDLREKIREFLADPALRRSIARRGGALVRKKHALTHRVEALLAATKCP